MDVGFLTATIERRYSGSPRAATPENPRFSLNDPAAWDAFGAGTSAAGIPINSKSALSYSPWFRGINLIANGVGKLPLHVYRRSNQANPDGIGRGKEIAADHPSYLMLRRKPNERMTAYVWKMLMVSHAMSKGNGYSAITRRGDGSPEELLPLDPDATYPVLENGKLLYVTTIDGIQRKILRENMFHLHGLGYDGIQGYDVITIARDALGLGLGSKRYATVTLKNMGRPATVLVHPLRMTQKAKDNLLDGWERMHAGVDNAGRTAVLDAGLDVKALAFRPDQMQMVENMEVSIRDIANFLGVAPHKLGDTSRTAYNSLEQENIHHLEEGLDPWLVRIEEECHDKLLREDEKEDDSIVVEFLRRKILMGDSTARANYLRTAIGQPWMSKNEGRDWEGLNPVEDGDEIPSPLNMANPGGNPDLTDEAPPKKAPPADKQANHGGHGEHGDKPAGNPAAQSVPVPPVSPVVQNDRLKAATKLAIADACGRVSRRLAVHAERAAAKGGKAFVEFADGSMSEHQEAVREICKTAECLTGRDSHRFELADWLLASAAGRWKNVAAKASAAELAGAVAREAAGQAEALTAQANNVFLE